MLLTTANIAFAAGVCAAAIIGAFVVPAAADAALKAKKSEIEGAFKRQIERFEKSRSIGSDATEAQRKQAKSAERWARDMARMEDAGKVQPWQAAELARVGIIGHAREEKDYVRINDAKWSYPATARTRLYLAAALAALCAAMLYPLTQPGAPSAWAALAGVLLMSGVLVIACCDWRAMTIPYQLCALAALPSIALALLTWGPSGFPTAAGWAVGITAIVWLLAKILGWFGLKGAIGSGDLRLMPWLCLPCGLIGSFCGLAACCAAMGAMGAGMWALRLVNRKSRLPMAPGLCVWLAVGYTTGQVMPGILGMGA